MYLSKNLYEFKYKNHSIKLLRVLHNQRDVDIETLKKLLDESNKRKVCYLLETDYRKNKIEIRQKFGDHTTEQFMSLLLKEEKQNGIKKCLKGWDIRQSILTQNNQTHLYGFFYKLSYNSLGNYYLYQIKERKVLNENIDKNIKIFIEHNYNELVNHYKKLINNDLYFIHEIVKGEENVQTKTIYDLIKKYPDTKEMFKKLSYLFFHFYAMISDLFLLETVLNSKISTDYIIIMGEFHFNDTINFINLMKKDNLF